MSKKHLKKANLFAKMNLADNSDIFKDIPERTSEIDRSLGILSINSEDAFGSRLSDGALQLQQAREMALNSLRSYSDISPFKGLPSKYLKKGDISTSCESIKSDSTVSESDLLLSSTPRESVDVMRNRMSLGQTVASLASSLKNPNVGLSDFLDKVCKTMDMDGASFCSESEAVKKLERDEMSWRGKNALPADLKDFSLEPSEQTIGAYFAQRSSLPNLLTATSPRSSKPVALLEVSQMPKAERDTLGLTDIQNILECEESTTGALDALLKPKAPPEPQKELKAKENIVPEPDRKSSLSARSSSALSTLPNGKIPIATTKTELVWGCVKPGKTVTQEFVLRNRAANRLILQCSLSNPAFRLSKEGSDSFSDSLKIVLHAYESRALSVTFAPAALGACVDKLQFGSADPNHRQTIKQFVKLFAYGGHGPVSVHQLIKDTTGKFLLSLGNIDEQQSLRTSFLVRNNGSLPSFAHFDFLFNGLYSFTNIEISPHAAVLLPGEERDITVSYSLQKKDLNYIKSKLGSCVIDLGKLQMIHGTEVDRARLRKMCKKAEESQQSVHSYITELVAKFPGEVVANDLKHFRESVASMEELLKFLNNEEITVTLEQNVDQTFTEELQDETVLFQSLCENTVVNALEGTVLKECCHVEPSRIILMPPDKIKDIVILTNHSKRTQYFEVVGAPEGVDVRPKEGTVEAAQTAIIDLTWTKKCTSSGFKVKVLVDNECFEVNVKVVLLNKM